MRSIEDHGYTLDFGISETSGFLPFNNEESMSGEPLVKLHVGQVLDVTVTKTSSNGRICTVVADPRKFSTSSVGYIDFVLEILTDLRMI